MYTLRLRARILAAAAFLPLLLGACGGNGSRSTSPSPTPTPTPTPSSTPTPVTLVPHFDHVAVVILENAGYSDIIGNTTVMPYLNGLATSSASASNYYANSHPSIGNYFMMTVGTEVTNDSSFDGVVNYDNLVRQMAASGVSWKSYQEDLPFAGYLGGNTGKYLKRHNPFAYLSDVVNNSTEAAKIVPSTQLALDQAANQLPQFIFITPNSEHDAHDCPGGMSTCPINDRLAVADDWLEVNIAPLLADAAFVSNGILIITLDEAQNADTTHGGGHIAFIVVGAHVRPAFTSTTFYQHESLLRLIADALRIGTVPGAGAIAPTMEEFFE